MPRPTLARARSRLSIVVRRAMSSDPASDPTLNTVVMKAYVLSSPWKSCSASSGSSTCQLNDSVATTPISTMASRSSSLRHT